MVRQLLLFVMLILLAMNAHAQNLRIEGASDALTLNEAIKDVIGSAGKSQLGMLASGEIQTAAGTTTYNQYLHFSDVATAIASLTPIYGENRDDEVGDFLYAADSDSVTNALFEYEIEFPEGLISAVDNSNLVDLENKAITILGKNYIFSASSISASNNQLTLNLIHGAVQADLKENEERDVAVKDNVHTIKLVSASNTAPRTARLSVDGIETSSLEEGQTELVSGIVVGISNIILSDSAEIPDRVSIFVGAERLTLKDQYDDGSFTKGISINGDEHGSAYVKIDATETSATEFKISKIRYRVAPSSKDGEDIYIPPASTLGSYLKDPAILLGSNWDIQYLGLVTPPTTSFSLQPSGDNKYRLSFTNNDDRSYVFPFVSNEANNFKLGDSSGDVIFIEGSSATDYNVDKDDYIVLTDDNDESGVTSIVRYTSIDTANGKIYFEELTSGEISVTYLANGTGGVLGQGEIVLPSGTYPFFIQDASNNPISIDVNGDTSINGGEANLVLKGGGIFDLGSTNSPAASFSIELTTDSSKLDEGVSDEAITITLEKRSAAVGISTISGVTLVGPDDSSQGMSEYGVFIRLQNPSDGAETLDMTYPESQSVVDVEVINAGEEAVTATCSDGAQNQGETGVDCGGPCASCDLCSNSIQDGDETGIDCGGSCPTACGPVGTPESPIELRECNGCWDFKTCVPLGGRTQTSYCHDSKTMKPLKSANEACFDDYQCLSNYCKNDLCQGNEEASKGDLQLINITVLVIVVLAIFFMLKVAP